MYDLFSLLNIRHSEKGTIETDVDISREFCGEKNGANERQKRKLLE